VRRLLAAVAVTTLAAVGLAAPAFAADDVTIRSVDATAFPTVRVSTRVGHPVSESSSVSVTENGAPVKNVTVTPVAATQTNVGVVLVVDTAAAMRTGGRLDAVKAATKSAVKGLPANQVIAIVAAGDPARLVLGFTQDRTKVLSAVDSLGVTGGLALWDGVAMAASNLSNRPDLQPNIFVVAGGRDQISHVSGDRALAAAVSAKALVFSVGVQATTKFDTGDLQTLASRTGGSFAEAADNAALPGALTRVEDASNNQFEITYTSTAKAASAIDVTVKVGGAAATASVSPGTIASGLNTQPEVVAASKAPAFLHGANGKWVSVGLVVGAAFLLALGILLLVVRDRPDLDAALRPYAERPDDGEEDDYNGMVLAETGFVQRAVSTTARLAENRGLLDKVEQRLEQAAVPLRAAEALFFYVAAVCISVAFGLVLGGLFGAIIAIGVVGFAPAALLSKLAGRRKKTFVSQLPDMLQLLSSTLRSGFSLLQGVEAVSQEVSDPMGTELRRVLVEARLGRPLEEALQDAADRMGSADFDWAIMAIRVQREVGGNLAELLDTVGTTMVERERLRRDVQSLTAEGRMSAIVLGLLPFGMGLMMYTLNPSYIGKLFTESLGKIMLVGGFALAVAGFMWMKKMINIEA
jgi:tight adherence protein B